LVKWIKLLALRDGQALRDGNSSARVKKCKKFITSASIFISLNFQSLSNPAIFSVLSIVGPEIALFGSRVV